MALNSEIIRERIGKYSVDKNYYQSFYSKEGKYEQEINLLSCLFFLDAESF